ncbi:MAG: histidine phosphatase family protein [Candidatus Doudnabacteria bacterium]
MEKLILVRHGFYKHEHGLDLGLFPEWIEITSDLGKKLQPFAPSGKCVRILTSPFRRCVETGQILAKVLGTEPSAHKELQTPTRAFELIKKLSASAEVVIAVLQNDHPYKVAEEVMVNRGKPKPGFFNIRHAEAAVIDWGSCAIKIISPESSG